MVFFKLYPLATLLRRSMVVAFAVARYWNFNYSLNRIAVLIFRWCLNIICMIQHFNLLLEFHRRAFSAIM